MSDRQNGGGRSKSPAAPFASWRSGRSGSQQLAPHEFMLQLHRRQARELAHQPIDALGEFRVSAHRLLQQGL